MPTSSGHENYNSDNSGFLHFEPIGVQKSPIASIHRSESPPLDVEQVDVDEEISSLFAMVNPSFTDEEDELYSPSSTSDPKILQKIAAAQKMLTDVHFENQLKAAAIEESVAKVQELRHRSEKLAKFNKQQVQQVQGVLKSFEQIRQEIITALGEFGGYDQVQALLQQMSQADASLRQAQRELLTHQTDLYKSLQQIQQQVEERDDHTAHLLQQSNLKGLLSASEAEAQQSVSTANGSGQMHLSAELQDKYEQLASKVHLIKVAKRVNKNSETIKILQAEIAESSPLKVTKRVTKNSETIKILQTEITELYNTLNQGVKQDVSNLNSLYGEMTSTWSETRRKQCSIDKSQRLFQNWLMTLSVAMVIMLGAVLYQFLR